MVWDWNPSTPPPPGLIDHVIFTTYANIAYDAAENKGVLLANATMKPTQHTYDYIHMIGDSAGAKLIDEAAREFASRYAFAKNRPRFVHLTFLDAYTLEGDKALYGFYSDYAEHYVDKSLGSVFASTDACLSNAFNFNISNWDRLSVGERGVGGHQWPRNWYKRSVTSTSPKFKHGFPLSLEGSGKKLVNKLTKYPAGQQCGLDTGLFNENPNPDCQPATCW